jgi:anti-anti-sigma factor
MYTLVLVGELDRSSTITLERAIESLCEREVAGITLDLRRLTRIDAIGVAVIAFRCGWCLRHGYEFALVPGAQSIQAAFARAGALTRLPFVSADEHRADEGSHVLVTHA